MPFSRQENHAVEAAEAVAIQALGFIAQDGERLGRFLALTGMGPGEIRAAARQRYFLAGVLDYLAGDEGLLVEFAGYAGMDPATIAVAQRLLQHAQEEDEI